MPPQVDTNHTAVVVEDADSSSTILVTQGRNEPEQPQHPHVPPQTATDVEHSQANDDHNEDASFHAHLHHEVPLVEVSLENVTYSPVVKTHGRKKNNPLSQGGTTTNRVTVLHNITTTLQPYQLTAWMGPSGSGKTSLISVAANLIRDSKQALSADSIIRVNGERGTIPKRYVGVVWQDDLLLSNCTVTENIFYAARLKSPETAVSNAQVHETVQQVIQELGLSHVANSLVGSPAGSGGPVRGVSGGERKRVSVAVELVVHPSVLFLDEPTSGLDATTAQSLMMTLKELAANKGHTVVTVIHQPRTTIYNMLDHLLLLSKGHVLYNGPATEARHYLESCPTVSPLPAETGLADWMMDVITADEQERKKRLLQSKDEEHAATAAVGLIAHWQQHSSSQQGDDMDRSLQMSKHSSTKSLRQRRRSTLQELEAAPKFDVSFKTQFLLLTERTVKQQRGDRLTLTAVILQGVYLFFSAIFWWRMPNDTAHVFAFNSLLFFMVIAQANGIVINAVTVFQRERILLHRERAKKLYGVLPYFLGKTVSDMSTNVLLPLLYGLIVYWTAGFRPDFVSYLKFALAFYMTLSTAQSMGLWVSICIPNMAMALVLAPPLTLFFMIMGGFYIPFQNMQTWVEWATWLSFARYGYSALIINQWQDRYVACAEEVAIGIGNADASDCPMSGNHVIASLGITGLAASYWFNIAMVAMLQVWFRVAAYAMLRKSK